MKHQGIVIAAITIAGSAVAYRCATASDSAAPAAHANTGVAASPPSAYTSPFGAVAQTAATDTSQVTPPPSAAPSKPTTPSAPLPAPIAKALTMARTQAANRPMTQVAKNWFGCATEDSYNDTLALIRQKSANTGDHFHGPAADCAPLQTGTHISVLRIDDANGIAQVSIEDTHQVYWTDTGALAGDSGQK